MSLSNKVVVNLLKKVISPNRIRKILIRKIKLLKKNQKKNKFKLKKKKSKKKRKF